MFGYKLKIALLHISSHLLSTDFQQRYQNNQLKKEVCLQQMMLGQLDIHMQKIEVGPYLTPFTKTNSKLINNLNIRHKPLRRKHLG